jgi:hypothetical protein
MKINGQDVDLTAPQSVADCYDVLNAISSNAIRGQAAALGLCARGAGRPGVRLKEKSAAGWLEYGGAIVDYYQSIGVPLADWFPAAQEAVDLVASAIAGTSADEVKEAEGNLSKSAEASTE